MATLEDVEFFSHHSVTLEEDKTIDIATLNVSIDHQKRKGSRLMIVSVERRKRKFFSYT
jgi:hypothetical protein